MNVRVVVADEREANFFDMTNLTRPLERRGALVNEAGDRKDQELETDRQGRRFGMLGHRHGTDGERSTVRHQVEMFARAIARSVDEARIRNEFDKLVIVAGPKMLGLVREALPTTCRSLVAAEVPKDLVQRGEDEIREAVPRETFFH